MSNDLVIGALDFSAQVRQMKSASSRRRAPQWDEQDERIERFITLDEVADLANVLVGTEDTLDIGLSQIGIDPAGLSRADRKVIRRWLRDREGVRCDNGEWVRDGETAAV